MASLVSCAAIITRLASVFEDFILCRAIASLLTTSFSCAHSNCLRQDSAASGVLAHLTTSAAAGNRRRSIAQHWISRMVHAGAELSTTTTYFNKQHHLVRRKHGKYWKGVCREERREYFRDRDRNLHVKPEAKHRGGMSMTRAGHS
jgi:hypothetical protein